MIRALALTGPTASGKTALSLEAARELGCEIISCDSMQIYKGMDIGTAKATDAERETVPHHLIDFLSPLESYSVERYRQEAIECAEDIISRGKIPLFVGGTGLYIDAVMRPLANESPKSSPEIRERLMAEAASEEGRDALHARLCSVDPESGAAIHKNNVKRLVRALEIFEMTGKPKSYFDALSRGAAPDISVGMVTLDFHNRDNLYARVDLRVDEMLRMGLVDEARRLLQGGFLVPESTAAQAIGYKELIPYLKGDATLDGAVENIKLSSRRYAKRQLTWFRHESDAVRTYVDGEDGKMRDFSEIREEIMLAFRELLKDKKDQSEVI